MRSAVNDPPDEMLGPPPDWAKTVLVALYEVIACVCVGSLAPGGLSGLPSLFDLACAVVWGWMPVLLAFQAIIAAIVLLHDGLTRDRGQHTHSPLGAFMIFGSLSILANALRPRFM